jgi:D-alanine-D-alanine ligase
VVVPAAIAPEINDKIRAIAVQAYQTLGCSGSVIEAAGLPQLRIHTDIGEARQGVDLVDHHLVVEVVINEINTLPGFTNISMYPKLWQASGLDYTSLVDHHLVVGGEEDVDAGHAAAAQGLVSLHRDSADLR